MSSRDTAVRSTDTSAAHTAPSTAEGKYSTWFGAESSSLLGTVHVPAGGQARGAVVLCPPLGKEQVDSYRGLTLLAQKLCATGLLVLRFDYLGTGDSHGAQDEAGAVERWQASIDTAVQFVRSCGPQDVALVGLRAGALLATTVAERNGPLTGLVLWDPVVRGRSYLHEQRALYSVSVAQDSEEDPRVSIIGAVLNPDVVPAFGALDATKLPAVGCPVIVATRPERADAKPIRAVVKNQNAEEHTLSKHELFLEPSDFEVVLPTEDISHLAKWVGNCFDSVTADVHVPLRDTAVTGEGDNAVTETVERLGPAQLFGIRTTSRQCIPAGPTVVFYPTANEHRVGPVRSWVELSRTLAMHGVSALRFDRRGTGESGAVEDDEITRLYSDEGNEDALSAVRAAGTSPHNVMVSGMCSGSWYSSFAARELGVNSAVLLNTLDWTTRRLEFVKRASMHNEDTGLASTALDRLHDVGVAVKNSLQSSMPYPLWFWLGTRGLIQVPEISLRKLEAKNVRTTVLLSPTDADWFIANRGPEGMNRLRGKRATRRRKAQSSSPAVVKSYAGGDHSLYGRDLRETVRGELLRAASEAFDVEISAPAPPVPVDWAPL
ncbi:serine aminopeptidase domain-containing protein [Rhodococcus sovatensis]|uniref:Alpha/beta hydrolase n=1 Tax=Rhodococcus sovatensis TaxID=1805840 RepID=A0ABZ2PHJ5_9NOCA